VLSPKNKKNTSSTLIDNFNISSLKKIDKTCVCKNFHTNDF